MDFPEKICVQEKVGIMERSMQWLESHDAQKKWIKQA